MSSDSVFKNRNFKKTLKSLDRRIKERTRKSFKLKRQWPPKGSEIVEFESYGFKCLILRGFNCYCGYVIVPEGHPDARGKYDDPDVDVNGGLTFRQKIRGGTVFGFDCAHSGDFTLNPLIDAPPIMSEGFRWNLEDVALETIRLAKQFEEGAKHAQQCDPKGGGQSRRDDGVEPQE